MRAQLPQMPQGAATRHCVSTSGPRPRDGAKLIRAKYESSTGLFIEAARIMQSAANWLLTVVEHAEPEERGSLVNAPFRSQWYTPAIGL